MGRLEGLRAWAERQIRRQETTLDPAETPEDLLFAWIASRQRRRGGGGRPPEAAIGTGGARFNGTEGDDGISCRTWASALALGVLVDLVILALPVPWKDKDEIAAIVTIVSGGAAIILAVYIKEAAKRDRRNKGGGIR
ncbi:MAG: hypothetical protein M0Z27_01590 [Thermaerobacter sp.]|nr:hypothetical protein [Thermaerobacter sp.]